MHIDPYLYDFIIHLAKQIHIHSTLVDIPCRVIEVILTVLSHHIMSSRRATNNRIRGPQSALTDFLASNNISAAQIRDEYERRRQAGQTQTTQDTGEPDGQTEKPEEGEEVETAEQKKKRKRQEEKAIAKIKQSKDFKRRKAHLAGEPDGDEDGLAWDMYAKSTALPGQLENCEICNKRFTVTNYSKAGPDGGLLCPKCSKDLEKEKRKEAKPKKKVANRSKQRQIQSNLLDGIVRNGSKSLQELCVEIVANNINDIEEFGDLPPALLDKLSQILSRRRVMTPRTLDLFLRSDLDTVAIYDCGKLETTDFIKIFSIVPNVENLNLRQAGQMKDEVIDYILERDVPIKNLQLDASNLISDNKWREFFEKGGQRLETLKLSWLDYSMDDETVQRLVEGCPHLKRLKIKKCFKLGDAALESLSKLENLEHLSLRFILPTSPACLMNLIDQVGAKLRTLSLEKFENVEDEVLRSIHSTCRKLSKLRFTENDYCTDGAYASLFTNWANPPLTYVDLNSNRDLDYQNPNGPVEAIGFASAGFKALMAHSGSHLECLDISSCRHIAHDALAEAFDGIKQYPYLKEIKLSFLTNVDTTIAAGMFKSCPKMARVTAFGCFNVKDTIVPFGVALIGIPNAQDSIIQDGDYLGEL